MGRIYCSDFQCSIDSSRDKTSSSNPTVGPWLTPKAFDNKAQGRRGRGAPWVRHERNARMVQKVEHWNVRSFLGRVSRRWPLLFYQVVVVRINGEDRGGAFISRIAIWIDLYYAGRPPS